VGLNLFININCRVHTFIYIYIYIYIFGKFWWVIVLNFESKRLKRKHSLLTIAIKSKLWWINSENLKIKA
jgi:hypothetical protein